MNKYDYDVVVVGAGLIGLATAKDLQARRPDLTVAVVDKEPTVASHQSSHNSGVIHAGLYYAPGSLKARLCRDGRTRLMAFATERGIPFCQPGKLVVATDEIESRRLDDLINRGTANGLDLQEVSRAEITEREPNIRGLRGVFVSDTGIIDYKVVAEQYAAVVTEAGGELLLGQSVLGIAARHDGVQIETDVGGIHAGAVITCAGLQADRMAAMTGDLPRGHRIVPFRGDYYTFAPHRSDVVRGMVYPVPDPSFPFLGVHFTRHVDGELSAGPNAVPALAREGYRRRDVDPSEVAEMIRFPGLRNLARKYARTGTAEIWRDVWKPSFIAQLRRYMPDISSRDLRFGPSGVRAQCMRQDGQLVEDFLIEGSGRAIHVINAPSPAATASLSIGETIVERALEQFSLTA